LSVDTDDWKSKKASPTSSKSLSVKSHCTETFFDVEASSVTLKLNGLLDGRLDENAEFAISYKTPLSGAAFLTEASVAYLSPCTE